VNYFEYYSNILFENFGDRVKTWITINEPKLYCVEGYGRGSSGPAVHAPGIGEYLCGHYSLLCHAAAYRLYKRKYYEPQKGEIGIAYDLQFHYPKDQKIDKKFVDRSLVIIVRDFYKFYLKLLIIFISNNNLFRMDGLLIQYLEIKATILRKWLNFSKRKVLMKKCGQDCQFLANRKF